MLLRAAPVALPRLRRLAEAARVCAGARRPWRRSGVAHSYSPARSLASARPAQHAADGAAASTSAPSAAPSLTTAACEWDGLAPWRARGLSRLWHWG